MTAHKSNDALQLVTDRLQTPGVFNVQLVRTISGVFYVFSNANRNDKMLEGWGVTLELAIQNAFLNNADILEDLLS